MLGHINIFGGILTEDIVVHRGLEGIYVTESSLSYIDGEEGKVYVRGYDLTELAMKSTYEEVVYLLIYGKLPNKRELYNWIDAISSNYSIEEGMKKILREIPRWNSPLDVLKYSLLTIGLWDREQNRLDRDGLYEKIVNILGKTPTILSAWYRISMDLDIIEPRRDLGYAANFLYMVRGEHNGDDARALDTDLILHIEHGMNASSFAGLVTISTLSDLYSAVTSSINTLKGPLHGGAAGAALKQFREIGSPENAEKYVMDKLSKKERIMGFGHRVYKTYDPRAKVLKNMLMEMDLKGEAKRLFEIALKVEEICMDKLCRTKRICPNVDFYAGILYVHLGFPIEYGPAIFALSRIGGWIAHILEYLESPRLIRPRHKYIGPKGLKYTPLEERD
ncbi:MAG TPA: citrate synthase [Thermoprotei archaeon]|nr:citrate synthase [Thermoprotei archaeon]